MLLYHGNTQLNSLSNKRITLEYFRSKSLSTYLAELVAQPPPPSSPSQILETGKLKFCSKRKSTRYTFTFICINDISDGDPSYDWSSTPLVVVKDDQAPMSQPFLARYRSLHTQRSLAARKCLNFPALYRLWWRLHISEFWSNETSSKKTQVTVMFVWGLSSHSRVFHSYGDVTITGEGLQILTCARRSWTLGSEGSLACYTYCNTYCRSFSSVAVSTCFHDLGLTRLGFEHPTFRLRCQRSNILRHRCGKWP